MDFGFAQDFGPIKVFFSYVWSRHVERLFEGQDFSAGLSGVRRGMCSCYILDPRVFIIIIDFLTRLR